MTLVLRNFNYPLPNAIKTPTTPSNSSMSSSQCTLVDSMDPVNNTMRSSDTTSTSTNKTIKIKEIGPDNKVKSYVDFAMFYQNAEIARKKGTLPDWWDA